MKKIVGACAIAFVLVLASCEAKGGQFEAMVPQDSVMAVYAPSPLAFLKAADGFMKASGVGAFLGEQSLDQMLLSMLELDAAKAAELFDLAKPSGLIVTGGLQQDMRLSVLLAAKKADEAKAWLESSFASAFAIDGPVNGYLVLRPAAQEALSWPPAKPLKAGTLRLDDANRLLIAVNYAELLADPSMGPLFDMAYPQLPGMADIMKDMLTSMGWASFGIGADEKALSSTFAMGFDPDTDYGKLMASVRSGKPTMADRLIAEELCGMAMNMRVSDPAAYSSYLKALLAAFGLENSEAVSASLERLLKAGAGDSYASVDLNIDGPVGGSGSLDNISFSASGLAKVSDPEALRQEMGTLLKLSVDLLNAMIPSLMESGPYGLGGEDGDDSMPGDTLESLAFGFELQNGLGGASLPYDKYSFSIKAAGVDEESAALLESLGSLLDTVVGYRKGLVAFGMGEGGVAAMEAAASGASRGTPLTSLPEYKELAGYIEPGAALVGHFNIARYANILGGAFGLPLSFDEKALGLLFSASYGKDEIRGDFAISTKEFAAYLKGLLPLAAGAGI